MTCISTSVKAYWEVRGGHLELLKPLKPHNSTLKHHVFKAAWTFYLRNSGPNIRIENIVGNYEINELGDAPAADVANLDHDSEENNAFIAFNPSVFANLLNEEISDSPNRFTLLGRELSHIGSRTVSLVNDLHCGSIEPNGDSNKGWDLRTAPISIVLIFGLYC